MLGQAVGIQELVPTGITSVEDVGVGVFFLHLLDSLADLGFQYFCLISCHRSPHWYHCELSDRCCCQCLRGQCDHVIHSDHADLTTLFWLQDLDARLALMHGLHMRAQVVYPVEATATLVTQVRFLSSVDDYVLGQVPHIHKGLATHAALVWSDVVMVANVIGQLAGLDESLATALTDVGLLPRVLAHMGDEGAGLSEGFATHHTLARLLTRVDPYVPLQRAWVSKLPLTVGAYVGFLPTVDPQVPLEVP